MVRRRLRRAWPALAMAGVAFAIGAIVARTPAARRRLARRAVREGVDARRICGDVCRRRRGHAALADRHRVRARLPRRDDGGDRDGHARGRSPAGPLRRPVRGARAGLDAAVRELSLPFTVRVVDSGDRGGARGLVAIGRVPRPGRRRAAAPPHDDAAPGTLLARDGSVLAEGPESATLSSSSPSEVTRASPLGEVGERGARDGRHDPRLAPRRRSTPKACPPTRSSA